MSYVPMAVAEAALRADWESARALMDRVGASGPATNMGQALGGLVAARRAIRRDAPRGSHHQFEYRRMPR